MASHDAMVVVPAQNPAYLPASSPLVDVIDDEGFAVARGTLANGADATLLSQEPVEVGLGDPVLTPEVGVPSGQFWH